MVTPLRHAPLSASTRAGFRTGLRPLVAAARLVWPRISRQGRAAILKSAICGLWAPVQ